jgi:hypothetical protein
MSVPKKYRFLWLWLKKTLFIFLLLSVIGLLLFVLLAILRIPSFSIGNDTFWLLRWEYQPDAKFIISFNLFLSLIIAAIIAFFRIFLKQNQ